jgi:hypothetical protein
LNLQIIIELFTQKIVIKLSKIWVWDPGVRQAKDSDPNTGINLPGSLITVCGQEALEMVVPVTAVSQDNNRPHSPAEF